LVGRADVEFLARYGVDLLLQLNEFLGEGVRHAGEGVAVDLNAVHLHLGQNGDEGAFEGFVDGRDAGAVQLGLEQLPQAKGHVGIFGGIFHRIVDGDAVEGHLRFACAEKGFDRDRLVAEVLL
jgi:hypothetical protein